MDPHWNEVKTILSNIEIPRLAAEGYGEMKAQEAILQVAENLLKKSDLSVSFIEEVTGCSLKTIEQLAAKIRQ